MDETVIKCFIKCVLVLLISAIASCSAESTIKYAIYARSLDEATRAGKDPLIVGCAYGFSQTGEAAVCAQAVSSRK